jgi:opacity protein-like surface antigen
MKKLLLTAALAAAVIAPTAASAADPAPADFKNAAKYCKEFKKASGANFATMFGTKKNAYGKCVSQTAKKTAAEDDAQAKQARSQAVEECRAVKTPGSKNAFGKCVSE